MVELKEPPKKSVIELCDYLEGKVTSFEEKGKDYLSLLADKAINEKDAIPGSQIDPAEFFSSSKFSDLQNSLQNYRQIKAVAQIKL